MAWIDLPPAERAALVDKLSERQLLVYICRLAYPAPGSSWSNISRLTGLQIRTCRTHFHAAEITHQQIRQQLLKETAA